jgi:hypothetical protein
MGIVFELGNFLLLDILCTIVETFNEEKHVWPSYFLDNFDSCVAGVMDYFVVFCSALGLCKNLVHIIKYSYVCLLQYYLCSSRNTCLNSWT